MATPPVPNGVEFEIHWTLDSQQCENRMFVDMGAPPTDLTMASLGGAVETWVNDVYKLFLSSAITFTEILLTDKSVAGGAQVTIPLGFNGSIGTETFPNETSFCVSLRTGLSGRSFRGRWYMPPPLLADRVGNNRVTADYVSASVNALQSLINSIADSGFNAGVCSFVSGGAPRVPPVITRYTAAVAVDNILDSQRRRKPGNGS
jgi:hypothetical protein